MSDLTINGTVQSGRRRVAFTKSPLSEDVVTLFVHATGFCKEIWKPVSEELRSADHDGTLVALDITGHGDTVGGEMPFDWWQLSEDVIAVSELDQPKTRLGVGHSMGGALAVMAEIARPGLFDSLILIEPILLPPPFARAEIPLVSGALRRRPSFSTRDEAAANFASKAVFEDWDERALAAYVQGGLVERDGQFWLKCSPEYEAEIYRGGAAHGAYARLDEIDCPVLVLYGELTTQFPVGFAQELAQRMARGSARAIPGTGHFSVMESPASIAREIQAWLVR